MKPIFINPVPLVRVTLAIIYFYNSFEVLRVGGLGGAL